MVRTRILALCVVLIGVGVGFFVYNSQSAESGFNFKLGLDLDGGTQLIYKADVSGVAESEVSEALSALRDVIERRVNVFGVSEPLVQIEEGRALTGGSEQRLIVELPGVTNIDEAIDVLGKTPLLEFKLQKDGLPTSQEEIAKLALEEIFIPTGLTGRFLERAELQFPQQGSGGLGEPSVLLVFNTEGKELFAEITRKNIGKFLAIFLDGVPISTPVIREEIVDGNAAISGGFAIQEARELVRNLNLGALPVPIELVGSQVVGATLGRNAIDAGVVAGFYGFIFVSLFLIFWYRLPGFLAVLSLAMYVALILALFKLIPVTLTAAAIAGLIMSFGVAVDANILVFERMREELKAGRSLNDAISEGFTRAWSSVRDSNISNIITASILFWFGTSLIKGFALVLALGVVVNIFTAIVINRLFMRAFASSSMGPVRHFLFGRGF
ncbi:MAG: hypothetical protein RJA61_485 [Candidatus Parcubacteria bacterium]|jgi:protein-export membrane protein SecD